MTRVLLLLLPLAFVVACATTGPTQPERRPQAAEPPSQPSGPATAGAAGVNDPVLLHVPADPTVAFRIGFAVGSQDDPRGKEGLAYLTATLMAEGATKSHSYAEILELLYPMASGYDVRVDKERITFFGRVHRDNLDAYTGLLLDAILRPAFTEEDFQRVRTRTIDYLEKTLRFASDEELGKAVLFNTVFDGTPYGHIEQGTIAGLKAVTLDDVRRFHRERFTRSGVLLGLGGGFEPALVSRMQRALAELPAGTVNEPPAIEPRAIEGRTAVIVTKPGPATAISLGFPIDVRRGEPDFYALWLANSWLGEHRNSASHLYQVIREARGLNYGDYSYIEVFPEGGMRDMPPTGVPRRVQLFEVWIRPVPNEAAGFALRAALREVENLIANGLTEEQFELTRSFLSKYVLHFADTTSGRLGYAMDDRFYDIPSPGHIDLFKKRMAELTREEVNAAIRKHLSTNNLVIAMVSQDGAKLAETLASGAPTPITYQTPKPHEVLEEDRAIASYPVKLDRADITVVPVERLFTR